MTTRSPDASGLRAALLDSGGVLMQPIGGRWNPRADFEPTVLSHAPHVTPEQFAAGIAAGDRFVAASTSTPDTDEYHRAILAELGIAATARLLADLRRPVEPSTVLEIFPEVPATLRELSGRGVRMAVVSDAWPDLPDLHAGLGIAEFFDAYAISAVLGCRKPDPRTTTPARRWVWNLRNASSSTMTPTWSRQRSTWATSDARYAVTQTPGTHGCPVSHP